jgi:hypothetical protein
VGRLFHALLVYRRPKPFQLPIIANDLTGN